MSNASASRFDPGAILRRGLPAAGLFLLGFSLIFGFVAYRACLVEVPTNRQAVLISKSGRDLDASMVVAPPADGEGGLYKGVQSGVLTEGRYFYNPIFWDWEIYDQFIVPDGKIGVKIAMAGEDLPEGEVLASAGQRGILREVLEPGRYSYNKYAEEIRLYDPVNIPAGFRGVVTSLAGTPPKDPNVILVGEGERGVRRETLRPGTYYFNPFEYRVSLVDCRSQRYDLSEKDQMDFLSADGFPIVIDGSIEFRVIEDRVSEIFVLYNEDHNLDEISEEIIKKIIEPESRSICRINGSKLSVADFIGGVQREAFERDLIASLKTNCQKQGVEIVTVSITQPKVPEEIKAPIQAREVAKQLLAQYQQEKLKRDSEAQLRIQETLVEQRKSLVEAEREVIQRITLAEQGQRVAVTQAERDLAVAKTRLEAAKDKAAAVINEAEADADVIRFQNKAEVAGLQERVAAFGGNGNQLAENVLLEKLAPSFRTILSNTDGPIMDLFRRLTSIDPTSGAGSARSTASTPTRTPTPTPGARPGSEALDPPGSIGARPSSDSVPGSVDGSPAAPVSPAPSAESRSGSDADTDKDTVAPGVSVGSDAPAPASDEDSSSKTPQAETPR